MELNEFQEGVRDVLTHLYDRPYLQTHWLAKLLAPHQPGEVGGHALQRIVLETIEALKPSPDVPYDSLPWRKYRYLYLRYVQGLAVPEIANDLAISLRQSRRYSLESLAAVARILWERSQDLWPGWEDPRASPVQRRDARVAPPAPAATDQSAVELEVARIKAQEQTTATPIGALVTGVVATIGPLAERRGIDLRLAIPRDCPTVAIERTALRQALLSLLSLCLGLSATRIEVVLESVPERAEVEVLIRCELCPNHSCPHAPSEEEGVYPPAVASGGGGHPGGVAAHVRADDRWHIAQRLVEAHGGVLDVLPVVGHGLTMSLRVWPVHEWKVLVVEDNPDTVELFRRYLGDSPYRIVAADNSAEALARAEAERPAVILLDVMMPARDGWETLQLLKSNPSTREIPVVICSVLKERDLALALGAAETLVKPVGRADLLRALECQCSRPVAARRGLPANSASDR